ncbi:MAG: hypothetical protein AABX28_02460 [Nanoarchaeota archaeon]|mgnify:FL=1
MELNVSNQILSICPTKNLKLFNNKRGKYEIFYKKGIQKPNMIFFNGLKIPVSPKLKVIKMKEVLAFKKTTDKKDILELKKLLKNKK